MPLLRARSIWAVDTRAQRMSQILQGVTSALWGGGGGLGVLACEGFQKQCGQSPSQAQEGLKDHMKAPGLVV